MLLAQLTTLTLAFCGLWCAIMDRRRPTKTMIQLAAMCFAAATSISTLTLYFCVYAGQGGGSPAKELILSAIGERWW